MKPENRNSRQKPTAGKEQPRRGGGPRAIAALVPKLTKKALGKRGLAEANLVADWATIVGVERAATSQPDKLSFPRGQRNDGTLHLRVFSSAALELQHDAPYVIDRINGYFGYAAIARLKLIQAPLKNTTRTSPQRPRRTPEPAELAALDQQLASVEDDELRETLNRLGTAVLSESGESTKN